MIFLAPREDCNSMNKCLLFVLFWISRCFPNSKLSEGSMQRRVIQSHGQRQPKCKHRKENREKTVNFMWNFRDFQVQFWMISYFLWRQRLFFLINLESYSLNSEKKVWCAHSNKYCAQWIKSWRVTPKNHSASWSAIDRFGRSLFQVHVTLSQWNKKHKTRYGFYVSWFHLS